jgi:hypothetical protein
MFINIKVNYVPLWSSSSVLQLVSEPVWSLVGFNRFCDLKRHREMCCEACCFQWRGFQLLEEPNPQLSLEPGTRHLKDHPGGVRNLVTRPKVSYKGMKITTRL